MLVKYATQGQGDPSIQPPKNCLEKANYYKVYIVKMRKREDPHTVWWRWHSSKYFFIKRKLSRNLWGSMFILTISLNFFAGTSKTSFNLDFKTWGKFVCFDLLVVGASSSLLYAKLTTKNCQKNFPNWNWFYMFQQKNSKKLLR